MVSCALSGVQMRPRTNSGHSLSRFSVPLLPKPRLRERIAALAPAILPKGVGAYSAAVLEYEMRGFERFTNRRQVGSMTGLCPGIHQSDGRGKEGSINRCGIGIVRWTLVEMVWRLMIWQPQYPPVRRLATGLVKG